MKIGLPRLRLSRKLLLVTLGITVLLGGSGVTALYFGGRSLVVEGGESAIGAECIDVQTMVVKTPSNHLWLRKFIRMENVSGHERVRTALRISGILAKNNAVDLIHVSVLDTHGPIKRADMRARAIGAEVLIALKPDNLPEMKAPAMASYYEGPVSGEGRFYGDKVVVNIDEIGAMMTAMRTVEEKPDCINPNAEADAAAKKDGHGKTDKKDGHAKPEDGDKPANDHGEEPAGDGADKTADHAEPAKEQSFLDSMLSMVGLGGGETKDETHQPAADAPAEASTDGHGGSEPARSPDNAPTDTETHDTSDAETGPADESGDGHDAVKTDDGHTEIPAADKAHKTGPAAEEHVAPAEDTDLAEDDPAAETADHGETTDAHAPADTGQHENVRTPKADKHAEAYMPVGD